MQSESVKVGACAQPVASSSSSDRQCANSSQNYDSGGRVVRKNTPYNNVLNFCNAFAPSIETPLRDIVKREKKEKKRQRGRKQTLFNCKQCKDMFRVDVGLMYNEHYSINDLHIQLLSISTIRFMET